MSVGGGGGVLIVDITDAATHSEQHHSLLCSPGLCESREKQLSAKQPTKHPHVCSSSALDCGCTASHSCSEFTIEMDSPETGHCREPSSMVDRSHQRM